METATSAGTVTEVSQSALQTTLILICTTLFSDTSILTARQLYIFVQDASAISPYIQVNTALYFILVPHRPVINYFWPYRHPV